MIIVDDPLSLDALAARHGLDLLAAELMASAVHHRAGVRLSEGNVGRHWPAIMAEEGIALQIG